MSLSPRSIASVCIDLGAGVAPYREALLQSFNIAIYIAVDIAPTSNTTLLASAECLPFRDESVDLVVSFDTIQHVRSPESMLDEVTRVLRTGGEALFTFPFMYPECDAHDFHRWTLEGMKSDLERRGLEIIFIKRRGSSLFASACALNWWAQHLIPGQRVDWRSKHNLSSVAKALIIQVVTIPTQILLWVGLGADLVLPESGYYMGGSVFVRKVSNAP